MAGERKLHISEKEKERVKGIELFESDDEIIIRVKKNGDYGQSKSGKTRVVATTGGMWRAAGVMIGLNVNAK